MTEKVPGDSEATILFSLVKQRYGHRLSPAELEEVRKAVELAADSSEALRKVRLDNSDEPFQPFRPYRKEG